VFIRAIGVDDGSRSRGPFSLVFFGVFFFFFSFFLVSGIASPQMDAEHGQALAPLTLFGDQVDIGRDATVWCH